MTPNRKDVAEFLRLGLRYQVSSVEAVVAWADGVIAEDDEPPAWAIELAFAKTADAANDQLKLCAGVPQGDLPVRIALGLVSLRWAEQQLNIEVMRKIGWDLYCAFLYRRCFDFIYEVSDDVSLWVANLNTIAISLTRPTGAIGEHYRVLAI